MTVGAILEAGSRLVLCTGTGPVTLRTLERAQLAGHWSVRVLAPVDALAAGNGTVEAATPAGRVRVEAHLRVEDGVLTLASGSAGSPGAVALPQRRQDVRGRLTLPLRATAADAAAERALGGGLTEGVTLDVSAGGLGVDLHPRSGPTPRGCRLYLELRMPGERLVPAVVSVVSLSERRLHGRFVDIAAADREHLVRAIFAEQRRDLAERRHLRP